MCFELAAVGNVYCNSLVVPFLAFNYSVHFSLPFKHYSILCIMHIRTEMLSSPAPRNASDLNNPQKNRRPSECVMITPANDECERFPTVVFPEAT